MQAAARPALRLTTPTGPILRGARLHHGPASDGWPPARSLGTPEGKDDPVNAGVQA
jgi:hypothetical protein